MLELIPQSSWSWQFIISQDQSNLGQLEIATFKSSGWFKFGALHYDFVRERLLGPMGLRADGRVVARARRTALTPKFVIEAEDRHLDLIGSTFLKRHARLVHGALTLADIRQPRIFRRAITIETFHNAPLPLVIFSAVVVMLYWRTASRGSA